MQRSVDGSASEEHPGCLEEQQIVDFAAGLLPTEKLPPLEEHLSGCERCASLVAAAVPHVGAASSTQVTRSIETQPFGQPSDHQTMHGRERPLLAPGTALDATYQVIRFLGRGGMGDVYEVKHARLAGRYAAKLLSSDLADNKQAFSRFQREAMIASGLSHPNIVNVIDFCHLSDGLPCLVMEFLNGNDLAQVMALGPLSLPRTLRLVRQIVSALGTLHGHQIIHRDLKPQNIFVLPESDGEAERVKLVDFGLAKRSNPSMVVTHDRTLLGTPQYMAPEQAIGNADSVGPESDQFSLAAIVYEMLGGRHPFGGEVLSTVLYRIVHEPPAPLGPLAPQLPAHVIAAIERGLSKDRQARFPSVKAFLQALEGEGAVMTPAPIEPDPPRFWSTRRKLLASAGALVAGAGIVALAHWGAPAPDEMPGEARSAQVTTPLKVAPGRANPSGRELTIEQPSLHPSPAAVGDRPAPAAPPRGAPTAAATPPMAPVAVKPETARRSPPAEGHKSPVIEARKHAAAKPAETAAPDPRAGTKPVETAPADPSTSAAGGGDKGFPSTTEAVQPPPTENKPPPVLIEKL